MVHFWTRTLIGNPAFPGCSAWFKEAGIARGFGAVPFSFCRLIITLEHMGYVYGEA